MTNTPIFHQVLSAGEWRRPLPEFKEAPDKSKKWDDLAKDLESKGMDMDEPMPTKKGKKK